MNLYDPQYFFIRENNFRHTNSLFSFHDRHFLQPFGPSMSAGSAGSSSSAGSGPAAAAASASTSGSVGGAGGANPAARIEELDEIQKEVVSVLQNASLALQEIGKDRPSQKATDGFVTQVMGKIKDVESKLSDHIKYLTQVSTGQPHVGSSYPSQKILQTAWHRLEHARNSVNELDRLRGQMGLPPKPQPAPQPPQQPQPAQQQPSMPQSSQ